jgi:hypothetical protein
MPAMTVNDIEAQEIRFPPLTCHFLRALTGPVLVYASARLW